MTLPVSALFSRCRSQRDPIDDRPEGIGPESKLSSKYREIREEAPESSFGIVPWNEFSER
jgi:hypothetical protein